MTTIYTHNGNFGADAHGTRDWFRDALQIVWADWHRDADTELNLEDYIEDSLDRNLIELGDEEAGNFRLLASGEALRAE